MRILHVSESLNPVHGGTPAVAKSLASAQAALGCEVTILTRDEPEHAGSIAASMEGMPGAELVRIVGVPRGGAIDTIFSRPAARWARANASGLDFAHLHSMWSPIPHGAARGLADSGVPYTLCPHGMLDDWSMTRSRARKSLHLALVSRKTLARAAFLHALSEHERDCTARFGFAPPIEIIGNGVQPGEFETLPDPAAFRAAHPAIAPGPFVVFLGRLHPGKGLELLTRAFARVAPDFPESGLVLVGPDAGAKAGIEHAAAETGIAGRIVFTGPAYGRDKLAALAGAACYAMPSEHEGFSVAICEALACGTPVVISPECHFDEAARGGAGVVVPREEAPLSEALARMLGDPEAARAMGRRGRELVFERYTWPAIAARSLELYREHTGA